MYKYEATITVEDLRERIKKHHLMLEGQEGGERLDLTGVTLPFQFDLRGTRLEGAILLCANLNSANLNSANLYRANLYRANLESANLESANLNSANLYRANLYRANLESANLESANLNSANLYRANLYRANLESANLESANLEDVRRLPAFQHCPEEGSFIAYKKVMDYETYDHVVLTLQIPEDAQRTSSIVGRKCRASKAVVLKAENVDGAPIEKTKFGSLRDREFEYTVGESVNPDAYNPDPRIECTSGLHFFITKKEAREYY